MGEQVTPPEIAEAGADFEAAADEAEGYLDKAADPNGFDYDFRRTRALANTLDAVAEVAPGGIARIDNDRGALDIVTGSGEGVYLEYGVGKDAVDEFTFKGAGNRADGETALRGEDRIAARTGLEKTLSDKLGEIKGSQLELLDTAANAVGSQLHELWRETRKLPDGSYEERVKPTKDVDWSEEHDGVTEVDIANTTFEELPDDWKEENLEAGKVVVDILVKNNGEIDLSDPDQRSKVGSQIHDAWISRNEWVKDPESGNPELAKPFDELPAEEQQKDIQQLEMAMEMFSPTA